MPRQAQTKEKGIGIPSDTSEASHEAKHMLQTLKHDEITKLLPQADPTIDGITTSLASMSLGNGALFPPAILKTGIDASILPSIK
jgi:hypothetical protein